MYLLEVKEEDIEDFCEKLSVGDLRGLNISVFHNRETDLVEMLLLFRTDSVCVGLFFDDPLEVEDLIASIKGAKDSMDKAKEKAKK